MTTKKMNRNPMMEIRIDKLTKGMRLPRTWSGYVVMPVPPPRQLNKEGPSPGNLKGQVPLSKSLDLGDPIQGSKRGKGGGYLLCTGALVGEGAPRGRGGGMQERTKAPWGIRAKWRGSAPGLGHRDAN